MIELDSAMIILMTEVLVGLLALAVVLLIMYGKRRSREHAAANELINRLEQAEISRGKKLGQLIRENCVIDNDKLKDILKEIGRCEQALYQQILQIFLKRDVAMLKEIDRYINKLAIPYCQVIQDANSASTPGDNEELEEAKAQISRLKKKVCCCRNSCRWP
nr:hypothetical protein [Methylomarinum sp. Ch1-1]MDP4522015.1 hypothetical protein [Methylomarinum sp. Ch1-1]